MLLNQAPAAFRDNADLTVNTHVFCVIFCVSAGCCLEFGVDSAAFTAFAALGGVSLGGCQHSKAASEFGKQLVIACKLWSATGCLQTARCVKDENLLLLAAYGRP